MTLGQTERGAKIRIESGRDVKVNLYRPDAKRRVYVWKRERERKKEREREREREV